MELIPTKMTYQPYVLQSKSSILGLYVQRGEGSLYPSNVARIKPKNKMVNNHGKALFIAVFMLIILP